MALTNCPDCSRPVSDQAITCLNCGRPIRQSLPVKLAVKTHSFGCSFFKYCEETLPLLLRAFVWLIVVSAVTALTFLFVLFLKSPESSSGDGRAVIFVLLSTLLFFLYFFLHSYTQNSKFSGWSAAVICFSTIKIAFALPSAFALPVQMPSQKPETAALICKQDVIQSTGGNPNIRATRDHLAFQKRTFLRRNSLTW